MSTEATRSEILETGNPKIKSARIVIQASPSTIFEILATPKRHKEIDGSKTITDSISGPDRLSLGAKFGMKMRLGAGAMRDGDRTLALYGREINNALLAQHAEKAGDVLARQRI